MILTNLVGTLEISNDETLDSQKIPIVSEVVLKRKSINGNDIKYKINKSVLGIGFLNGNFKSVAFFDGVITYLESVNRKKIPNTFKVAFNTDRYFSIFVGKEICENKYVSVKLIENMNHNVFEVKSVWINNTKVTDTPTFLYFGMRKHNKTYLSSVYFRIFLKILKKELRNRKEIGEFYFGYDLFFRLNKRRVQIEVSENIISEVNITFKLNNTQMVFPLKNFLPYLGVKIRSASYGRFCENRNKNSELSFNTLVKCFDFYIDEDKNTIGFKRNQFAKEKCSVEYNK